MPELTTIQSQVLAGLLAGKSISAVARENGIHRSTIYNWRHEQPCFTRALDQARSRHRAAVYDFAQDLAEQALETVEVLLASEDANLRLRAAQLILRVAEPSHPKDTRPALDFAALDRYLAPPISARTTMFAPIAEPEPAEVDTTRQNSTLLTEQSRNSRCKCGSGLKYKRCCGNGRTQEDLPETRSEIAFAGGSF